MNNQLEIVYNLVDSDVELGSVNDFSWRSLCRQIQGLQGDVRQRIAKLSRAGLSGADRKTLDDARTFFAQSTWALNEAHLQRALTLARKASLLVLALER